MKDDYLNGKYSINEVIAGKAEHDVSGYLEEETAPITAEVTFYGFDGQPLGTVAKDVSTSAQTFTLAEAAPGADNARAKTFYGQLPCRRFSRNRLCSRNELQSGRDHR